MLIADCFPLPAESADPGAAAIWLMLIATAMGMYLINAYSVFKVQTCSKETGWGFPYPSFVSSLIGQSTEPDLKIFSLK